VRQGGVVNSTVHIDPRIRERRIQVTRAAGRRRLRVLIVIASVVGLVAIGAVVVKSPFLDVDRVVVRGTVHLTAADVKNAAHVELHSPLLLVNTGAIERRIERLPWVQHATVTREWPGTIRVKVTEYVPAAYARVGTSVVLIAANGHAIARAPTAPAGTIEVRGLRRPPADGELLSPPDAAGITQHLPAELAQQVVAIDVGGNGVALLLGRGGAIRLGSLDDLDAKAAATLAVLAQRGDKPFAYIDVSTPATPVLRQ
jgi:cell division protein FtsQ